MKQSARLLKLFQKLHKTTPFPDSYNTPERSFSRS
jgi:hypothetical protein